MVESNSRTHYLPPLGRAPNGSQIISGAVDGGFLVLETTDGQIQISLEGIESAIDFSGLSEQQVQALTSAISKSTVCDAFNNELGSLV